MIFGATCLVLPLLLPATIASYLFTLIWIGFVFLLDPVNRRLGLPSLLDDFAHGQRNRFWSLFVAGWTCGWLWELWNYWAAAKWHYTFPMFQQLKIFEMPIPGYLGFLPFALECFVMYTSARWLLGKFGLAQAQDASPQATALPQPAPYYRAKQGNLLTDMPYGICPNTEHGCELSYRSKRLAHLHDLLQRMQAQESRGAQVQEIETLAWFARYFQTGTTCKTCGVALCTAFQPTTGLDEQAEEYERRIRLNHLLALTGELQARGVL